MLLVSLFIFISTMTAAVVIMQQVPRVLSLKAEFREISQLLSLEQTECSTNPL